MAKGDKPFKDYESEGKLLRVVAVEMQRGPYAHPVRDAEGYRVFQRQGWLATRVALATVCDAPRQRLGQVEWHPLADLEKMSDCSDSSLSTSAHRS
jgi:hypothetical protein